SGGGAAPEAAAKRVPLILSSSPVGTGWLHAGSTTCRHRCSTSVAVGSKVTVSARPVGLFAFHGWARGGAKATGPTCTFTVAGRSSVTGLFQRLTAPLSVSVSPAGGGSVAGQAGISCPGTCSGQVPTRTTVQLTATPATGYRFAGWGGACSGTALCTVAVPGPTAVSATFQRAPQVTLTLNVSGGGNLTVQPGGGTCSASCTLSFDQGTVVTVGQQAGYGWQFSFW